MTAAALEPALDDVRGIARDAIRSPRRVGRLIAPRTERGTGDRVASPARRRLLLERLEAEDAAAARAYDEIKQTPLHRVSAPSNSCRVAVSCPRLASTVPFLEVHIDGLDDLEGLGVLDVH